MSLEVSQIPLEEEYRKHRNISPEDIARLRAWLRTQPHLPEKYITDLDLILAYHCCDRSSELAKQVLDLHYTLRTHSVIFRNRHHRFEKIVDVLKITLALPLKVRAHDGSAAMYTRLLDYDIRNFNFCDAVRSIQAVLDLWQFEEGSWPGLVWLIDLHGVTVGYLSKLDLVTLQQLFYYLQEAMLLKIKSLHYLNAPPFIDKLLFLIRPFMKKELLSVLHVHSAGLQSLERHYPRAGLPRDAGGDGAPVHEVADYIRNKVTANRAFFESELNKRVDETLRPGKPKNMSDFFGSVDGSFKKLDID